MATALHRVDGCSSPVCYDDGANGLNRNFCPPMATWAISPLVGMVNTSTPSRYFAFSAAPSAAATALTLALIYRGGLLRLAQMIHRSVIANLITAPRAGDRSNFFGVIPGSALFHRIGAALIIRRTHGHIRIQRGFLERLILSETEGGTI